MILTSTHCVTTYWRPHILTTLCIDHHILAAIYRPLYIARCISPAIYRPLYIARYISPAIYRPPYLGHHISHSSTSDYQMYTHRALCIIWSTLSTITTSPHVIHTCLNHTASCAYMLSGQHDKIINSQTQITIRWYSYWLWNSYW